VQEANAQKPLKEFELITFKGGESIDDFAMRLSTLITKLCELGETVEKVCIVKKFFCVVPMRYSQITYSIEMFSDLDTMTIKELSGKLRAAEDRVTDEEAIEASVGMG
jgi:hypothetical protein